MMPRRCDGTEKLLIRVYPPPKTLSVHVLPWFGRPADPPATHVHRSERTSKGRRQWVPPNARVVLGQEIDVGTHAQMTSALVW
jgi:hypothetical protein